MARVVPKSEIIPHAVSRGSPPRKQLACSRTQEMILGLHRSSDWVILFSCCSDWEGKGYLNLFLLWLQVAPRRGNQLEQ